MDVSGLMDLLLPLVAFALVLLACARSLGWGLSAVVAVGYLNGVVRANVLGVFSTFMFDAGLLGLYVGFLVFYTRQAVTVFRGTTGLFVLLLTAWPAVLSVVPVNDVLVQLVALRGTVWFLPVVLIATRLTDADLTAVTRTLGGMNLVALAVAGYEFQFGIEAIFPRNAVTELMYRSGDVAGGTAFRIPSTFMNAHSYGGAMVFTLPFFLGGLCNRGSRLPDRILAVCGLLAAVGGLLLCAARSPIVVLAVATLIAWVFSRFNIWFGLVVVVLTVAAAGLASTSERLQRAATLDDTQMVSDRVAGSVNLSFLDILVDYPLGAGMGSSVGTSIPFFLADRAPEQVGLENEFSRITVDQGWIGLGLWLTFIVWVLLRPPPPQWNTPWQLGRVLMFALVLSTWGTAYIGTGALAAIPQSVLMLAQMGILAAGRERRTAAPTPALPPTR